MNINPLGIKHHLNLMIEVIVSLVRTSNNYSSINFWI